MTVIRNYRLVSLSLLLLAIVGLFLGFFFVWVLAPVAAIGVFYLVLVGSENRRALGGAALRERLRSRRAQLELEARARREALRKSR